MPPVKTWPLMPSMYNMIAIVMLQSGFEPGFELVRNSQGIVEPIQVPVKGETYGLGYVPTDDDEKTKKKKDQALANPIPHLYQSFPIHEYAKQADLGEGICDLFEKIDAIIEEEVELTGFCDVEPGDILQTWTSTPVLIP